MAVSISERVTIVRQRIERACQRSARSVNSVRVIAATKQQPQDCIDTLVREGIRDLGENYVQALRERRTKDYPGVCWHFIGALQSNKARVAARLASWVHSVDRSSLVAALENAAQAHEKSLLPSALSPKALSVLIQVNVSKEPQKSGCAVSEVGRLAETIGKCASLELRGLMTVPPRDASESETRRCFAALRGMAERYVLKELSMGMSGDFEVAIEEGATMVRLGTMLCGPRAGVQS